MNDQIRTYCITLLLLLGFASCSQEHNHHGKMPLVELDGQFLYKEDLQAAMPIGLSADDSVLFASHFIRNWLEDLLLFEQAKRNIPDKEAIDRRVANYRKALIVHDYQQALITQQLSEEISEEEITAYYKEHSDLFKVEKPLIRGLFIKVPLKAQGLSNVRRWYKARTPEAVEQLEKYSLKSAVKYDYFYDRWLTVSEVAAMMPLPVDETDAYLKRHKQIELKDTAFCYYLDVSDYLPVGAQEPEELARSEARSMLINLKQVQFFQRVRNDLYERAVQHGRIVYTESQ